MKKPQFFKFYLPNANHQCLAIPRAFLKHIEGETSATASLIIPSGNIWHVGMIKNLDGVFFQNGWQEFVSDNYIKVGYFLLFRYNGSLCFTVRIFDTSGCEKEYLNSYKDTVGIEVSERRNKVCEKPAKALNTSSYMSSKNTLEEPINSSKTVMTKPSHRHCCDSLITYNPQVVSQSMCEEPLSSTKVYTRPSHEVSSSIRTSLVAASCSLCKGPMSSNIPDTTGPAGSFRHVHMSCIIRNNMLPVQRSLFREPVSTGKKTGEKPSRQVQSNFSSRNYQSPSVCKKSFHSNKKSTEKPSCQDQSDGVAIVKVKRKRQTEEEIYSRYGTVRSQRRSVTEKEIERALEDACMFKSKNPTGLVVMRPSYVYYGFCMALPRDFVSDHLRRPKCEIILWDPNGKAWPTKYIYNDRGLGVLSGGWAAFSYNNNIEKDDVCVFELLKSTEMQVHIFRVVEEIKPLIKKQKKNILSWKQFE